MADQPEEENDLRFTVKQARPTLVRICDAIDLLLEATDPAAYLDVRDEPAFVGVQVATDMAPDAWFRELERALNPNNRPIDDPMLGIFKIRADPTLWSAFARLTAVYIKVCRRSERIIESHEFGFNISAKRIQLEEQERACLAWCRDVIAKRIVWADKPETIPAMADPDDERDQYILESALAGEQYKVIAAEVKKRFPPGVKEKRCGDIARERHMRIYGKPLPARKEPRTPKGKG
ncbi:MAG: hypothetical protein U0800_08550 [Isosphaeraceae bacterium]